MAFGLYIALVMPLTEMRAMYGIGVALTLLAVMVSSMAEKWVLKVPAVPVAPAPPLPSFLSIVGLLSIVEFHRRPSQMSPHQSALLVALPNPSLSLPPGILLRYLIVGEFVVVFTVKTRRNKLGAIATALGVVALLGTMAFGLYIALVMPLTPQSHKIPTAIFYKK